MEDITIPCSACQSEMQHLTTDEGGLAIFWCPKCGTIFQGMDEGLDPFNASAGLYTCPENVDSMPS